LLGQRGFHACQVGQALRRQDAHHAGLARPSEERNDVPAFASQTRELVDDDEARSRSLRGDAHQVEQNPGADLRRQRRVGGGVETEEDGLSAVNGIFEGQSGAKVLAGDALHDEPEAGAEPGDTFAFELAESVDLTAQSRSPRRAELAQQRHELIGFEQLEDALGCALQAGQVDRLGQPQQIAFRGGTIDIGVA
jgi:hypothetical protein